MSFKILGRRLLKPLKWFKSNHVFQLQMRHLFIVVDMSRAMEEADLKPSRLACSVKVQFGMIKKKYVRFLNFSWLFIALFSRHIN